jgi:LemA protein
MQYFTKISCIIYSKIHFESGDKNMTPLYVILGIVVIIFLYVIGIYNRLVSLRNRIENAWAQIDVQLKRRFDLIPNLVETVKGYASHEKTVFENVTKARNMMSEATTVKEQADANNMLTGALKSLFAVAEAYPELKANQNFMALQTELTGTEDKISYTRQFYNDAVMTLNTMIQTFPSNIIASMFGFTNKEYFEIEDEARQAVKVSF